MLKDPAGPTNADATAYLLKRQNRAKVVRRCLDLNDVYSIGRILWSGFLACFVSESRWGSATQTMLARRRALFRRKAKSQVDRVRKLLPEARPDEIERYMGELEAARYELVSQCVRGRMGKGWHPHIKLEGLEHIDEALASGTGCILWVAHFVFAPNVVKAGLFQAGRAVTHLSRLEHGFSATRFGIRVLNPVRSAYEDRLLAGRIEFERARPAHALIRVRRKLLNGEIVSLTSGAWEGGTLVDASLGEGRTKLAVGPVWLARATGARLLPVFAVRTGRPDEYVVEIGNPVDVSASASSDVSYLAAVPEFLRLQEAWIRRYPEQWRGWRYLR